MIRMVALDLDGTLLDPNNKVTEETAAAIHEASAQGVQIVLCTARWFGVALRTARRLEVTAPLICHSGAHIRAPEGDLELLHLRVPEEAARQIAAFCDDLGAETYTTIDGVTYMRTRWEAQIDPARLPQDMRLAKTHAEYVTGPVTGFVVFGDEAVQGLIETCGERYAEELVFPIGSGSSMQTYVTITGAGSDKGRALRLVAKHLNVPGEEILAMGDAQPDVDMFRVAGTGVAMGNAPDDVKEQADAVAPSNAEDGVAWAIRKFVLNGR
jgi:Cof subfamily protein (haloacid dehalogenase superfamily)